MALAVRPHVNLGDVFIRESSLIEVFSVLVALHIEYPCRPRLIELLNLPKELRGRIRGE